METERTGRPRIGTVRINFTLKSGQAEKMNRYIVNVAKKLDRVPHAMKTKIVRMALDEWLNRHEEDFDIDWNSER